MSNLFQERLDEIIELIDETNFDDLMYYFRDDIGTKNFYNFKNGIKLFWKNKIWWHEARKRKKTYTMGLNKM